VDFPRRQAVILLQLADFGHLYLDLNMNTTTLTIVALALVPVAMTILAHINRRVAKNEQRLLALLRHFGLDDVKHPKPSEKVLALLACSNPKKTEAIRQYRAETGLGLKEAARAIEEISEASAGSIGA
jgi:ribosomal protein L7/L12